MSILYVSSIVHEFIVPGDQTYNLEDFASEANMQVSQPKEFVHTLNRKRQARGYRRGPMEIEGSMTCAIPIGFGLDFYALLNRTDLAFRGVREGGSRIMYTGVAIEDIDESGNADGTIEWSLSIKATGFQHKP
jgi:hypothetical protein